MNILIVGNVLKDVYLNLDSRTENFEQDGRDVSWLNISFDASSHHFFNRTSSFAGAAVSLEVLTKMGFPVTISDSEFQIDDTGPSIPVPVNTHRYILTSDNGVSYLVPSQPQKTSFTTPIEPVDYLYIDRSAHLTPKVIDKIVAFLDFSKNTRLILYLKKYQETEFSALIHRADLIFYENRGFAEKSTALASPLSKSASTPVNLEIAKISPEKVIFITENTLSYLNMTEPISVERIDRLTHLSAYSIAAATVLGGFMLGKTVEYSLRLARFNVENSTLNSSLSLTELENLILKNPESNLELIAASLVLPKKGILAADESGGSIAKKFAALEIPDTKQTRHDYRDLFFTTKNIENYLNGIILFDETARDHMNSGQPVPDFLISKRIIPGIKVDQGLENFPDSTETFTKGLDDLPLRLREYYQMGLRFAKWRAAFNLTLDPYGEVKTPTEYAIAENCRILASFAHKCQSAGLVPIVEPELVYDGYYPIEKSASVTKKILDCLMKTLTDFSVNLHACILKTNMVLAGKQSKTPSTPAEVGAYTSEILKSLPKNLAGVVFLSGGQTPEQATENLAAIIKRGPYSFPVTFSFARALQDPALYTWVGDNTNAEKARAAFLDALVKNTDALNQS